MGSLRLDIDMSFSNLLWASLLVVIQFEEDWQCYSSA